MDRLEFCRQLARDAGALALESFGQAASELKGRHDVVTAADREVERFIRREIAVRYPGEAMIGEEEGGSAAERVWIVDPIDGTANFARGIPHWCVSIAYAERGAPAVGAIAEPCRGIVYSAARGEGAWLGGEPMRVSDCTALEGATVEIGWSTRRPVEAYVALVDRVLRAGCAFRRVGSGALGLVDVAAGRSEGYCELHINAWDCAAGLLLVEEAGGRVNDFFAGEGMVAGNPIIATNAALADALAAVIGIPLKT
jgi:myo-inositol-1(or 4)-monophosphatase